MGSMERTSRPASGNGNRVSTGLSDFRVSGDPEQRLPKEWRKVIYIEAAPSGTGKMAVVTLFVTTGDVSLRHESEPSLCLASLDIGNGRRAQLVEIAGFRDVS